MNKMLKKIGQGFLGMFLSMFVTVLFSLIIYGAYIDIHVPFMSATGLAAVGYFLAEVVYLTSLFGFVLWIGYRITMGIYVLNNLTDPMDTRDPHEIIE